MLTRISLLFVFIQMSVLLNIAYAEITYVSLHEIETEEREPLFLRLNIVGSGQNLPLKYTLLSQNSETEMAAHLLNTFMVRLASIRPAIGESYVLVYEFNGKTWQKVQQIDISNKLKMFNNDMPTIIVNNKPNETSTAKNTAEPVSACTLERTSQETLWSIASRYKDTWRVNVFSAMIAIFQSNKAKFTNQHIGHLIDNETLVCPSRKTIAMMGDKEAMRTEFFRLNELPF